MNKKSSIFRIVFFLLSIITVCAVIICHNSLSIKRLIAAIAIMAIGAVALMLLDKCIDNGADIKAFLNKEICHIPTIDLIAFALVTFGAIYVRISFLYFASVDGFTFFVPWIEKFRELGVKTSLGCNITDYSCMRTTVDALLSVLPLPALTVAKIMPICCDFANAVLSLLIFKEVTNERIFTIKGVVLYACMLLNPISVLNGAAWAQSDSCYTVFVLAAVWQLIRTWDKKTKCTDWVAIMFALAFACKLQAIFAIPVFFLVWVMQRRTEDNKGIRLTQLIWFPIVYFLSGLPMFLCGRTLGAIFGVYFTETGKYLDVLLLRYYNLYSLIGEKSTTNEVSGYVTYGIILGLGILLCLYYYTYKRNIDISGQNVLKITTLTVLLLVFVLPCMHERYAFVGEMTIIILAVINKKYIIPAIVTIISTSVTYADYLLGNECFTYPIPAWLIAGLRLAVLAFLIKDFTCVEEKDLKATK